MKSLASLSKRPLPHERCTNKKLSYEVSASDYYTRGRQLRKSLFLQEVLSCWDVLKTNAKARVLLAEHGPAVRYTLVHSAYIYEYIYIYEENNIFRCQKE